MVGLWMSSVADQQTLLPACPQLGPPSSSFFLFLFFLPSSLVLWPGRERGWTSLRLGLGSLFLFFFSLTIVHSSSNHCGRRTWNGSFRGQRRDGEGKEILLSHPTSPTLPKFSLLGDSELFKVELILAISSLSNSFPPDALIDPLSWFPVNRRSRGWRKPSGKTRPLEALTRFSPSLGGQVFHLDLHPGLTTPTWSKVTKQRHDVLRESRHFRLPIHNWVPFLFFFFLFLLLFLLLYPPVLQLHLESADLIPRLFSLFFIKVSGPSQAGEF